MVKISRQLSCQKFIYKIHSSRLKKAKWNLTLPLHEARQNEEVISLADSQVLRWIDELNGVTDADQKAREIKSRIRQLKKEPNSVQNRREIKRLYETLDEIQFKPDYMCLIIGSAKDYYRACKGFSINGNEYCRLVGTSGGVKNSVVVFVSTRLAPELRRRIDNGRDVTNELVPAKLEAYRGLTCSASNPVSMPKGILVVNDAETEFVSDYIYLTDENDEEPQMELRQNQTIHVNASDGFGLMLPSLAERWSKELGLDYLVSGVNTRFAYEKGMLFTFDFIDFADKVAGAYIVQDAWGNSVDIRNVEAVLTTSMVKLWSSYNSCEDYIQKSLDNQYTFAVTKSCPEHLENERNMNYQFIQSYDLDDNDIDELIEPTITEIKEVLSGDWRKTICFLKGFNLDEHSVAKIADDYVKAIMIDKRILNDPYVQNHIYQLIKNRIDNAKTGVIKVHGNYSIVSGDPYLLCQSMFNLEKTGLLGSGEIYNEYWTGIHAEKLACFRAPMSCYENIRLVQPKDGVQVRYWYQYMKTCTILNGWDTTMAALNGCDFDGDLVMLTDNPVLVRHLHPTPALCCVQRSAKKKIPTEDDLVRANINSFGNDIGSTTNRVTSMYEVRSGFDRDSQEYNILSYRIRCGQLQQQACIDKTKGIISKPMPKTWYDYYAIEKSLDDISDKKLYHRIKADKKPYFMIYIYPKLKRQYNTYIKNANRNALRKFQKTISELKQISEEELTQQQVDFLWYYDRYIPVGTNACVMNKICWKFEKEFDGYIGKTITNNFDYHIMKGNYEYTDRQRNLIENLYINYNKKLRNYAIVMQYERVDEADVASALSVLEDEFKRACYDICSSDGVLCDILLDICYKHSATRKFVWSMCGKEIIHNLLAHNKQLISFPKENELGSMEYAGKRFCMETIEVVG